MRKFGWLVCAFAAKLSLAFGVAALAARPVEAEGLPEGYTVVGCLVSHGTEYIDTEVVPNAQTRLVVDFKYDELPPAKEAARNGWGSSGSLEAFMFGVSDAGKFVECVNSKTAYVECGTADCNRHVVDLASGRQSFDDAVKSTTTIGNTAESGQTMYLFAYHGEWYATEGKMGGACKMRIYSCQIYDGTTLVRNFVPCLNAGGEPVLYDLVGQKDYANKGEGAFGYDAVGSTIVATLTNVETPVDGQAYGSELTVVEPTSGYQVAWSTDGETFGPERPTFTEPGEHTVFCRITAAGYRPLNLSATVKLTGTCTLAGADESGASSMNGTSTETVKLAGWTDPLGVTWKDHVPSAGNDYVANGPAPDYVLRTPTTSGFTFGGDSLTLSGGVELKVKVPNNGIVTIPNLIVAGNAQLVHGDGSQLKKVAGAIDIREAGALKIDVSYDDQPTKARQFEIQSTLSGSGSLWTGVSKDGTSGSPYIKFSGSLADFTGKIIVHAGDTMRYATRFNSNFPGDPAETMADGLTLEGNAALEFGANGTLGATRGISFGSGTREILVDSGKTVQINGLLTGTGGFKKTGAGKLVLARVSPEITGTVTVAAGTLQLCGIPEEVLPNATVEVSSGAIDEYGPAYGDDARVTATLKGVYAAADGQAYGPELTVTEPAEGWQAVWSTDGVTYTPDYPAFDQPGEYPVFCRVSADGYMTRSLRATVKIGVVRRIVATEAEKGGVWSEATVAGDDPTTAIQGVIDACEDGDAIYVKPGTYGIARELTFASTGAKGVLLRSDDGEGNLAPETTVFDGGYPARTNRVFSVNSSDVTFQGITVRNGMVYNADGGGIYAGATGFAMGNCIVDGCIARYGAGLYAAKACRAFTDVVFRNGYADKFTSSYGIGAGAYFVDTVSLTNCTFRDNVAYTEGGGVYFGKVFTVSDCVFTNCSTSGIGSNQKGGGIFGGAKGSVIDNCRFLFCSAHEAGAGCYLNGSATITDCIFSGSCVTRPTFNCNGIIYSGSSQMVARCTFSTNYMNSALCASVGPGSIITNCVLENQPNLGKNHTAFTRQGSGLPVQVVDCVIRDTYANYFVASGVNMIGCMLSNITMRMSFGGGVSTVRNCLFTGCPAPIRLQNNVFENCSFVDNAGGAVVEVNDRKPALTNCVFWGNTPYAGDNFRGTMGLQVYKGDFAAVDRVKMANCVLQRTDETLTEAPNMCAADKTGATAALTAKAVAAWQGLLVAPSRGDSHPRAGSPLVDAGVWCDWMEGANDLDGKPRVVGAAPDVGCYERQGDEIDPPLPCTRAVAKEEDKTGVWTNAFVGLPEALEAAYVDEPLYVKAGTYNVTEPVSVKTWGVRIIGEGPGKTVVDGGYPARTNRLFTITQAGTRIRGMTLQNAAFDGNGGAILVSHDDFTLDSCVVSNCCAGFNGGVARYGGGVYVDSVYPNVLVTNTFFTACQSRIGCGVACCTKTTKLSNWATRETVPVVSDCEFVSNAAYPSTTSNSGATAHPQGTGAWGVLWVEHSRFAENTLLATDSHGAVLALDANAVATNCLFEGHTYDDCAIVAGRGDCLNSGNCRLSFCTFRNNAARKLIKGSANVENCVIVSNAFTKGNDLSVNGTSLFRNCLFACNTGAASVGDSTFENCTFATNEYGICHYKYKDAPIIRNCVTLANTGTVSRLGTYYGTPDFCFERAWSKAANRKGTYEANVVLGCRELPIYGGAAGETFDLCSVDKTGATSNIVAIVEKKGFKFVDPAKGNWRLRRNSPLRDAALTLDWMTDDATDLDGKPRRISSDGKSYPDSLPDIGCYECDIPKPGLLLQVW